MSYFFAMRAKNGYAMSFTGRPSRSFRTSSAPALSPDFSACLRTLNFQKKLSG